MFVKSICLGFTLAMFCAVTYGIPYPFIRSSSRKGTEREFTIQHLPCGNKKDTGVCMFAWDCMKAQGTHLGTCIDRFYFGSCCKMKAGASTPVHKPMDADVHIQTTMTGKPFGPNDHRHKDTNKTVVSMLTTLSDMDSVTESINADVDRETNIMQGIEQVMLEMEDDKISSTTIQTSDVEDELSVDSSDRINDDSSSDGNNDENMITEVTEQSIGSGANVLDPSINSEIDANQVTAINQSESSVIQETNSENEEVQVEEKSDGVSVVTESISTNEINVGTYPDSVIQTELPSYIDNQESIEKEESSMKIDSTTVQSVNERETVTETVETMDVEQQDQTTPESSLVVKSNQMNEETTERIEQNYIDMYTERTDSDSSDGENLVDSKIQSAEIDITTTIPLVEDDATTTMVTDFDNDFQNKREDELQTSTQTQKHEASYSDELLEMTTLDQSIFESLDTTSAPASEDHVDSESSNSAEDITETVSTVRYPSSVEVSGSENPEVGIEITASTLMEGEELVDTGDQHQETINESTSDETETKPEVTGTKPADITPKPDVAGNMSNGTIVTPSESGTDLLADRLGNSSYKAICGQPVYPSKRIVGGSQASFGEWPWQVSLRQWRSVTFLHKCGAALVNENWAITAAHCVENAQPDQVLLRIGEYDLERTNEPYAHVERKVQIIATHPQFDPNTFEYDVALLRFGEPVKFAPNIIPICIPDDDYDFIGDTGFVTGWGRLYEDGPLPSVMQKVPVPVITNADCQNMYRSAGYIEHIPNIFLCAGYQSGKRDSCEGDSGGPLVIQHKNSWKLAGVISWGIGCALPNQPGVYTRISAFREWINKIMVF